MHFRDLLLLVTLAACQANGPGWPDAPAHVDPEPSGPSDLQGYKDSYFTALGRSLTGSISRAELLARIARTRVLWLGDHHADEALHARHRALLAQLIAGGARPALLLEAIGSQDELLVQRFLAAQIKSTEMRREIQVRWPDSWLESEEMDGAHWMQLLLLAQRHALPVHALEPTPRLPLAERDARIAQSIARAAERYPDRLIVVIVGSTHLLGKGDLIRRVGLPHVAIGSRLSTWLQRDARGRKVGEGEMWVSESGVLFFG